MGGYEITLTVKELSVPVMVLCCVDSGLYVMLGHLKGVLLNVLVIWKNTK